MLEYSLEHHLILLTLGGSGPYFMPGSINAKTEHTQLGSSALLCNKAIFKKFLHAFLEVHMVLIEQSDLLHRRRVC